MKIFRWKETNVPGGIYTEKRSYSLLKGLLPQPVAIESGLMERIPVKSTGAVMKEEINGLLEELYQMRLTAPVKMGDVIIRDYKKSGVDIVTTRSLQS